MARVLLLEDEPTIRYVVSLFLEDAGFETITAVSGEEAIRNLHTDAPVDVIVLDLLMPEMTGKEFLRRIRAVPEWSAIPAVLVTGAVYDQDTFPPPESYHALLQKPFRLPLMVETVQDVLSRMQSHTAPQA